MPSQRTKSDLIVSLSFLGLLTLIGISGIWDVEGRMLRLAGRSRAVNWDQRATAAPPALPTNPKQLWDLPEQLNKYADDHFGFRYSFVRMNKQIYKHVLRDTDSRNEIVGAEGWRYLKESNSVLDYAENRYPFQPEELEQLTSHIVNVSQQLQKRDIGFLFVIAPNKHSVYPEYLPSYVIRPESTRADELIAALAEQGVASLDMREALIAQKSRGQLFEKTGSHWTDLGATIGFETIMKRVQELFPDRRTSLPDIRFELTPEGPFEFGEQPEMLPQAFYELREQVSQSTRQFYEAPAEGLTRSEVIRLPNRRQGTGEQALLVFRDSFFTRLEPLFLTQFASIDSYWQTAFDFEVVKEREPDIVVWEFVERHLMRPDGFSPNPANTSD